MNETADGDAPFSPESGTKPSPACTPRCTHPKCPGGNLCCCQDHPESADERLQRQAPRNYAEQRALLDDSLSDIPTYSPD